VKKNVQVNHVFSALHVTLNTVLQADTKTRQYVCCTPNLQSAMYQSSLSYVL